MDAQYEDFDSVDPDFPLARFQDLSGNQMVRAPDVSFDIHTDYTFVIDNTWNLIPRTEYFYRSKMFFTPFNSSGVKQDGFGIWDVSLTFEPRDGLWYSKLFVKNLADRLYYQEKARSATIVGTIGWPGEPRTYGLEIGVHY